MRNILQETAIPDFTAQLRVKPAVAMAGGGARPPGLRQDIKLRPRVMVYGPYSVTACRGMGK